jgi:hypothetical protein
MGFFFVVVWFTSLKIGTLIFRSFWALWTTEIVGAMRPYKKSIVRNIFRFYNPKYPSPYKLCSLTYFNLNSFDNFRLYNLKPVRVLDGKSNSWNTFFKGFY